MIDPLTDEQREQALALLPNWTYDAARRAFRREIRAASFSAAIAVIVRIALEAEKADHHPDWRNVYDRIDIRLTTHDAGDVSARDVRLARAIDAIVAVG